MNETTNDIEDKIYKENYTNTMKMLELSQQNDSFDIETVKNELESLYLYEGLDWTGRGELKNAEISGAIAAYQVFIHNYLQKVQN